jgi:TetR/AcrR family transcriptional regulator of autoinduction and epiphytic fitness
MPESERRRQLMAAAADRFLDKGYHATTMDDVARAAGMSKKTLYQLFATKSELIEALLGEWFAPFAIPVVPDGRPVRAVLTDLLSRLVMLSLEERQVAMTRVLIAELRCSEELSLAMGRQDVCRGKGALDLWLAEQAARGALAIEDPEEAANMLFFAAAGDYLFGTLLRIRERPSAAMLAARIERVVGLFLDQAGVLP